MKISLIEVLRNVVKSINAHFFTNRAVSFTSVATGKSYGAGYCNFFFPIPYTPEPYTATLSSVSVINVGTATVVNYYSLSPCYIYVRVQISGLTSGGIYQATATVNMVVGGVLRNPVVARLLAIFKTGGGVDARKSENSYSKGSDLSHWTRNLCDFYKKRHLILNLLWNDQLRHFEGRIHTYRSDKRFLKPGSASLLLSRNINVWEHCDYWCKSLCIRQRRFLAIDNHNGAIHSQRFCSVIAASERGWCAC